MLLAYLSNIDNLYFFVFRPSRYVIRINQAPIYTVNVVLVDSRQLLGWRTRPSSVPEYYFSIHANRDKLVLVQWMKLQVFHSSSVTLELSEC
jgi:hypothetical protein